MSKTTLPSFAANIAFATNATFPDKGRLIEQRQTFKRQFVMRKRFARSLSAESETLQPSLVREGGPLAVDE